MNDLFNNDGENIGGIYILMFAPRFFFNDYTSANKTFKEGYDWIKIKLTSQTGQIEQESGQDNGDNYYNVTVTAALAQERSTIDVILNKYSGLPCVVKCTDQNGYLRMTGHFPGELVLQHSSTSGEKAADENGYQISFKGKQQFKAEFLTI
jgi:hypothetical protein